MDSSPLDPERAPRLELSESLHHAADVRRLARRLVHDDASADDLVQETWLAALQRSSSEAPEPGWQRWLYGVARNVAREGRRADGRRRRRERVASRDEAQAPDPTPLERLEGFQRLTGELAELPDPYRSTILRRYFEAASYAEIARLDGVSEATVRSRHARGLELLRERLDRRHRGGRAEWMALWMRLDAVEGDVASGPWTSVAIAAGAWVAMGVALVGLATLARPRHEAGVSPQVARDVSSTRAVEPAVALVLPTAELTPLEPAPPERAKAPRTPLLATTSLDERRDLVLTIVDERTSRPLARYHARVGVVGSNATLDVVTDELGRVTLAEAPASGTLAITQIDEPRLEALRRENAGQRSFPWTVSLPYATDRGAGADAPARVEVRVAVGPTLRLSLSGAPNEALSDAWVELVGEDVFDDPRVSSAPLRAPAGRASATGDDPWVRFLADAPRDADTSARRVRVLSRDGAWVGETLLDPVADAAADAGGVVPRVAIVLSKRIEREAASAPSASDSTPRRREPWSPVEPAPPSHDGARRTLKLRAFEARTGERIDAFVAELALDDGSGRSSRHTTSYGNLDFTDVPTNVGVRFVASAPGYRPVRGDRGHFAPELDHDVARLAFVRGWQRTVRVLDARSASPVAGARVDVDGARAGVTDHAGEFVVTLDAAPTRLDVRVEGAIVERAPAAGSDLPGTVLRYVARVHASPR